MAKVAEEERMRAEKRAEEDEARRLEKEAFEAAKQEQEAKDKLMAAKRK